MPVSLLPAIGFTLTIPSTASFVAVDDITFGANALSFPDNCRTVVVYNMGSTDRILVKFMLTSQAISALMDVNSSTVIPALSSMTFDVGVLMERASVSNTSPINLFLKTESGVNIPVNVTYLMGKGSSLP
jgi:hypothetical protein